MLKSLTCLTFFFFVFFCRANSLRPAYWKDNIKPGFKIGYYAAHSSHLEGGLFLFTHEVPSVFEVPGGFFAGYAGIDFEFPKDNFIMGPQLGIEGHYGIFGGRTVATYLSGSHSGSFQYSLEGGLSFLGWVYIMAGYNWTLSNKQFINLSGFKLSAGINIYQLHSRKNS